MSDRSSTWTSLARQQHHDAVHALYNALDGAIPDD